MPRDTNTVVVNTDAIPQEVLNALDDSGFNAVLANAIPLPVDWSDCERGNVYLVGGDGEQHLAYFAIQQNYWLEVSLVPANYPAFNVAVVQMDENELAQHIIENCTGWTIRKLNIKGVPQENSCVQ